MATETVENLANKAIYQKEKAGEHTLELSSKARAVDDAGAPGIQADASWYPAEQRSAAKANIGVYL